MKYFALALLVFVAACGEDRQAVDYSDPGTPARGDRVVEADLSQASSLVTWLAGEAAASSISNLIYRRVLKYDKSLNIVPGLAASWQVSADNKTITFTLEEDARWHDGSPVTSADVEATYKAVTDPATRTPYGADYQLITNFEVLDAKTFHVTYEKPFSPALSSWVGFTVLPKHVLEMDADFNETRLKSEPLGNGPFQISARKPAEVTTFKAVRKSGVPQAHLDGWQIRVIPDQDTQFLELKAGNLDMMALKPVQTSRLTGSNKFNQTYAKYSYISNGYTFVGFNLSHPFLGEKTVRQALSYATPRRKIVDAVLFGEGVPAATPYKPGTWVYNDAIEPYPFDLNKARQLLMDAGFKDPDENGVLDRQVNGKWQPLKIRLITNQGNDLRLKSAEILQYYWRQIGVDVDIQVQEWATFLENTLYPRDFDAFILGWSLTPDPDQYAIWHSSQNGPRQFNVIDYNDAEVDRILEAARTTFDKEEQKRLYYRFQEILHEQQPYLFLYVPTTTVAVHRRIKGIEPAPAGISHNVEEWYVPHKYQTQTALQP